MALSALYADQQAYRDLMPAAHQQGEAPIGGSQLGLNQTC